MTANSLILLVGLGLASSERVVDSFSYADAQTARRTWVSRSGTPPVDVASEDGKRVLEVAAPFGTDAQLPRTIVDRDVKLDLSAPGQFRLRIAVDLPEAVGHVNLYFHSGRGWYSAGKPLTGEGWQTLDFSKADYRIEDHPTGWHEVDRIRISAWRGQAKDATLRLGRLSALSQAVAIVVPAGSGPEAKSARDVGARIAAMLSDLGLGSDAIDEPALTRGALGDRSVAVLAHNPSLGKPACDELARFVARGGKLFLCYTLPPQFEQALGIRRGQYFRQARSGDFAEIRFQATGIPGLPKSVRQASWNIMTAEPVGHNARVIGHWYDDTGEPTGHAAMLISDRGAYLSHIVLADDREGKKQMLAAVLGQLCPSLWRQMARCTIERAVMVGHCDQFDKVAAHVKANADTAALECLAAAKEVLAQANERFDKGDGPAAIRLARRGRDLLAEAYLRAQPSPPREGRAVWNHSGTGAYPGDWDRSCKELREAGLNMVIPNLLWAGRAHYPSDVLPRSKTFEQFGDQIAQCVAAAKRHGVEVHAWKVNYNLSGAPAGFVAKMRREGRTQVSVRGQRHDWLCPSHPENLKLERDSMLEVARKYDVDGLHFDYIRYPGREHCYCEGCRRRFEADSGRQVVRWPDDCHSGERRGEYHDWRCKQITKLVAAVHRDAKKVRPQIKISAAVFGSYPSCRESVGQDWPDWIKAGYLDFVCPMDYTESDQRFAALVAQQLPLVDGRIPVYPGIGATASRSALTADRVVGQVHHARSLGAAGFTIFNFDRGTAESVLPGVGLGAGSQPAAAPHRSQ